MADIVVVGAGIIGCSLAYHLARQGASVSLIERGPAPAVGVTGSSFAWIGNTNGEWPEGAQDLRSSVLEDYRRLQHEVPALTFRTCGSLAWTAGTAGTGPVSSASADDRLGPGQRWLTRSRIAEMEPNWRVVPERAVHTPTDATIDPAAACAALASAAADHGAQLLYSTHARSLKRERGRVQGVVSSTGFHPATTVVLAAGTATSALCAPLGLTLPVAVSPACLLYVAAPPGSVRSILAGPDFEVREVRPGRLLATLPHVDEWADNAVEQRARTTFQHLRAAFGNGPTWRLLSHRVGKRPVPPDGPAVGYLTPDRSLYAAVAHSGVALGATVGRLAARDLTGEEGTPHELQRCRPRASK